jgi:tRNA nucleotidyltransferase (CCA-adding enzyme)
MTISPQLENFLKDLGAGANHLGYEIYIVGGTIRNELFEEFHQTKLHKKQDLDLVINTNAIDFTKRYQKFYEDNHDSHITFDILEEFEQFGTIKINHPETKEYAIEIASTRAEVYQEPAAFPTVTIIDSIEKDLTRRDFTINALLKSLNKLNYGEIIDHVNGISDIQKKLVRVFHDDSFIDDPTRIYRAVRMMLEYDFTIEEHTHKLLEKAIKHPDFNTWFKKRKNRFEIEKKNILKLGDPKAQAAKDFFIHLSHNF